MAATRRRRGESWVVYRTPVKGSSDGVNAVCSQAEWAELELARPGYHALLRGGIKSEGEAERLARGTSGDTTPRGGTPPAPGPAAVAAK